MEKIALLPGGFKPPHAGHYNMAKWLAKNTDANTVVVKVGAKEREGITRDISLELWDLYRSTDSDPAAQKLTILPATSPSPVRDVYDFIEFEAPENSTVYLGLGEKDREDKRYANIGKFAEPKGINFETTLVPPQAGGVSGTQMRGFIKDGDKDSFKKYLPDHLTDEQKDQAWNLVSSVIVKETFSSLFNEYHQNLINEDIKDYGHVKEYNLDLTNSYNYSNNGDFWVFYDDVNDLDIYAKLKANKGYKEFKFYPDPQSGIGFGKLKHHNPKNLNTIFNIFLNEVLPNNPKVLIQPADNIRYRLFKALINNNLSQDDYNVYLSNNDDPVDGSPKIIVTQKTPIKEETTQGKTLYAFDLDDTLITSNSQVIIKNKNTGEITKLTPAQYATYVPKEEDEIDFQEFAKLINPQAISKNFQDFAKILKVVSGKPNATAIILTARQPEVQTDVNAFLDQYNLDNIQIHAVGSSDPQAKAKVVQDYIDNGYDKIRFYDDAVKNVKAIQALELTNQGVDILAKKVAFNTGLSEMMAGTMNKQELAKHQKNLKKLNKVFRKQGDQMVPVPDYIKGTLTRKLYEKENQKEAYGIQSPIYRAKDVSDVAFHLGKIYGGDNPAKKKSIKESQTYVLDTPKYNNLPVDKVYYQLSSLVKEIKLTKDNATEIIGTPTKGDFKVGEIEYTYNIVKKSSPYKDNEDFYLIEFDEKGGKGDSEPTKNAKESYIKILSTLYKVILNFLEKEQPTYFGISALDKSGYWNVYNQLTKQNQIPGYSRKDAGLKFTTNSEETGKMVILKKNQNMKETKLFSKEWWGGVIDEILTEGGAAGHMAHPFDLPNVTKGSDLIQTFEKAADSLEKEPGSVKIDGVNASIRLGNFDGKRQFVMDRGSKKELDIKGVTKDDLEARFGAGHGMIKAGGDVLDIFNDALKTTQPELTKLGLWDDPNIMFNMEYVTGKTNVQEYEKNFLAIHGLLKIEMKEVEGKRGTLTQRVTTEQPYNTADLQSYLNKLVPFAEKKGFEVYGSVPTTFTKSPDFNKVLNTQYTIEFTNKKETKSLKNWLKDVDYIPKTDRLKMNLETGGTKDVGALSKQVYFAVFGGENVEDLFDNEQDIKKAIQGAITYLATEKLGDAILDVLDSPMGSVNNHEGVVIRDKSISPNPFKITGKFITGGVSSQFQQKENINENEETINFDIEDIRGYKVVLATLNDKIVGKLRLIPYPEYYQVENVLVDKDLRGMGIGKNLYLLARKELGKPIHSDKYRTPDAEYLWKSLVKSGDAQAVEGGIYVMKEETNPPQYNVADEIGISMYTSDLRENKVPYDKITNDITRQIYDILALYNEGDMPYGQAYEEDLELNFPTMGGIEPLDATITIIPKRRSIYAHEITGEADENGIYIRVEFLKDELPEILNDMMPYIKGVVRHELEHIGQYYTQNDPKTRDLFEPDSYVEAQTFEEYTLKPEEINAYVKELNRIRKTQNISFRDALKNYFRDYKENFRSEAGMRATMKAWLQRAKELKIID